MVGRIHIFWCGCRISSGSCTAQAAVGNVAAGSLFTTMQGVAATTFLGTVEAPIAGTAAVVGGVALFIIC